MSVKQIIKLIDSGTLFKHWERDYSLFFCSTWFVSHNIIANSKKYGEGSLRLNLGVYFNGISQYYRIAEDNERFLEILAPKIKGNPKLKKEIFDNYSKYGDNMLSFFKEIESKETFDAKFINDFASVCANLVGYQLLIIHRSESYNKIFEDRKDILEDIYNLRKKYGRISKQMVPILLGL